jgi:DNA-binding transcriptional ArsR family regulator
MSAALDQTLAALADPTRRRVVDLLHERPRRAGELAIAAGMSPPAMSRHLRVLRRRGLVEEDRMENDARVRVYRLAPERFNELSAWLREVESFWTDQLDAFKLHAEPQPTEPTREPQTQPERPDSNKKEKKNEKKEEKEGAKK